MDSFSEYIKISLDHIPKILLSQKLRQRYMELSSNLPEIFAHYIFGYEILLTEKQGIMDLSVSALNTGNLNFASVFNADYIKSYMVHSAWQNLKIFSHQWISDENLKRHIHSIALEFDASSIENKIPVPSVFFGNESLPSPDVKIREDELTNRLNAFISAAEIVTSKRIEPEIRHRLEEISGKCNGSYQVFQLGLMLSRETSPLKICLKNLSKEDIIKCLKMGFTGSKLIEQVKVIINSYARYFDELVLTLDITGEAILRIGIESYFLRKKQPPSETRWEKVITKLVEDKLCSEENASEILHFPNKKLFMDPYIEYYAQGLHHLKFFCDGQNIRAKAYLWAGFSWKNN